MSTPTFLSFIYAIIKKVFKEEKIFLKLFYTKKNKISGPLQFRNRLYAKVHTTDNSWPSEAFSLERIL